MYNIYYIIDRCSIAMEFAERLLRNYSEGKYKQKRKKFSSLGYLHNLTAGDRTRWCPITVTCSGRRHNLVKKVLEITLCAFDPANPGPYEQYILPHINAEMQREPERFAALGAAWNSCAVGAAVLTDDMDDPNAAALASLYVDPQVRRLGIGTALLDASVQVATEVGGAGRLTLFYTLAGEELDAMDRIVRALGGEPEFRYPVYTMDSSDFHGSRLVGRAFLPDYKMPENVIRFLDLTPKQLETLHSDPDAPWYSPGMQPELSLAYLRDGHVVGFWLGCKSTSENYAVQGIWRSSAAPFNTFHALLTAHVNLCYTHCGGDFLYHCSTGASYAEKIVQTYAEGKYRRLERHYAVLTPDFEK